jgi:ABC-type sugar transport system ATPase subunit
VRAPGIETSILSLSGGNQQKVVLAKWLLTDVRVLFLDEPTRGIDVGAKVEIYSIMTELARNGVAIVMISSELPELLAMCDRFVVLAKGRSSGNFTCEEISDSLFMKAATGMYCKD